MSFIVKGSAEICGKNYNFPSDGGYGMIFFEGKWSLVEFSCPFETCPPKGGGSIISQSFKLEVNKGVLEYDGKPVHVGELA